MHTLDLNRSQTPQMTSDISLRAHLDHEPTPLKFGTSGRRGLVIHLTQLEIYINALAELEYLQSLPVTEGGILRGEEFYFASDLRPSSTRLVPEQQNRGGIAQAIEQAIADAGMKPVFLGQIPTPALASFALQRHKGSIMVTGSHIPFDRNGYKTNTSKGELLKKDESPIQARVDSVRARHYAQPYSESLFDARGMLKSGTRPPGAGLSIATEEYLRRYTDFFAGSDLHGKRFVVYEHSAVGRDLLADLLRRFGAEVIPSGRSETFVPIDTENIEEAQLRAIQILAADAWKSHGTIDAVVSTDGDSDRPLILGVEPDPATGCRVRFFGGDLLGMIVAEYLGADAVVVPISCNDAVDRGPLKNVVEPKTRIGSPFVIAGMEKALARGRKAVCGWEANGGFLTGSDMTRAGRLLKALPTRDAFLPILGTLFCAAEKGISICELFDVLPRRFSRAALLKEFPRAISLGLIERFSPTDPRVNEVVFSGDQVVLSDIEGRNIEISGECIKTFQEFRLGLSEFFNPKLGFDVIERINYTDGLRIYFAQGRIAHVRPSGNADELRIYSVADTLDEAETIVRLGVAEPDGILRQLAAAVQS
jgi:phosphomannomutase